MTPLVVDPSGYLKPHHSVGHCRRRSRALQFFAILIPWWTAAC